MAALELPDPEARTERTDKAIYEAMVGALRTLDRSGLFGKGADRWFLTVNVIGEKGSEAFFKKGPKRLNPGPFLR